MLKQLLQRNTFLKRKSSFFSLYNSDYLPSSFAFFISFQTLVCAFTNTNTFLKVNFIGVQLFYNVVLVSAVQQSESLIRIPISLSQTSFSFRSPESTEQSSLCRTVGSHQLSVLYTVPPEFTCQPRSLNSSHPSSLLGICNFICVSISM